MGRRRKPGAPKAGQPIQLTIGDWCEPGDARSVVAREARRRLGELAAFSDRLAAATEPSQLSKALKMLGTERFRLFADVEPDRVTGVVRSQSTAARVYSCRLSFNGTHACCTQKLLRCVVSVVSPCKHLLVLVVGLMRAGEFAPETALAWLEAARVRGTRPGANAADMDAMAATFLRYKGVEAGEFDWRPTETIPEDYYAL